MARRKTISDEAVLDAAAKVMFAKGPTEFTLADIARAAGIAPATLVQRFGDKRGLVVAAMTRENEGFAAELAALPPGRSAQAVIQLFRRLFPDVGEFTGYFADQLLWLRQDMADPDLNRLARARFQRLRAAIAARLPPLAIPADEAARLIEGQWQGALLQWGIEHDGRLADFIERNLRAWFRLAGADLADPMSAGPV
jgi:AcrR family transcriptional regulator